MITDITKSENKLEAYKNIMEKGEPWFRWEDFTCYPVTEDYAAALNADGKFYVLKVYENTLTCGAGHVHEFSTLAEAREYIFSGNCKVW